MLLRTGRVNVFKRRAAMILGVEKIKILKREVFQASMVLVHQGLINSNWGNVSAIDRELEIIVIKPNGVAINQMSVDDMVMTDLDGKVLAGKWGPSSDILTHVVLYQNFKKVQSIAHSHSKCAVAFAQSGRDIPVYGTTHADMFYGPVPCTRQLTKLETERAYEVGSGKVIVETFKKRKLNENALQGVLVAGHGPYTWGVTVEEAVENSTILEGVSGMALHTEILLRDKERQEIPKWLQKKRYFRKYGAN